MFLLRILPKFFIFVILLAMTASIYYFQNEDDFITLRNTSFILIISFTLILTVLFSFYEKPILRLELLIKKFLVGSLKTEDSNIPKTYNPHLNYIILFLGKTLNDLRSIRDEFLHGKTIKGEVELGREIQAKLLHKSLPEVPELKIVARSKPAGEIGGDSFDVIAQWDNYYIYVWDATGHGVGAGFIMMMVNALVSAFAKVTPKGNHILALTNEMIKPRVKANLLMSMLLLRWNSSEKKLFMTWAGHEYLMIYKHKEKKCYKIKSGWLALWMIKDIHKLLKEQQISFEPNDVAVLYSDGITEAINKPKKDGSEEMFGEQLLISAIEGAPEMGVAQIKTANSIFRYISIQLSKFMGYQHVQLDDITLATLQYISPDYDPESDCSPDMGDDFITEWNWKK